MQILHTACVRAVEEHYPVIFGDVHSSWRGHEVNVPIAMGWYVQVSSMFYQTVSEFCIYTSADFEVKSL